MTPHQQRPVDALIELLLMDGPDTKLETLRALSSMLRDDAHCRVAVARAGGLAPLIEICRCGGIEAKEASASALDRLAHGNPDNQAAIGRAGGIPPLVCMLSLGSLRGREKAAGALERLAHHCEPNTNAMIEAGAVGPLLDLLKTATRPSVQEKAAEAIARVGAIAPGAEMILLLGGKAVLEQVERMGSQSAKRSAAKALRRVCTEQLMGQRAQRQQDVPSRPAAAPDVSSTEPACATAMEVLAEVDAEDGAAEDVGTRHTDRQSVMHGQGVDAEWSARAWDMEWKAEEHSSAVTQTEGERILVTPAL